MDPISDRVIQEYAERLAQVTHQVILLTAELALLRERQESAEPVEGRDSV